MDSQLSRRGFFKKAGSAGLLGAAGLAGFQQIAKAQGAGLPQSCANLPFGLSREDLVHLFIGPWRGLRAVLEKKVIDLHAHPFGVIQRWGEKAPVIKTGEEVVNFVEDMIESMNIHGIAKQCVQPPQLAWAVPYGEYFKAVSKYPDRLIPFADQRVGETRKERVAMASGKRRPSDQKAAAEILRARLKQGAKALGESVVSEEDPDPVMQVAMEFDVPLLLGGKNGKMRWPEGVSGYSIRDVTNIASIASKYPDAKIICADAGGKSFINGAGWDAIAIMSTYPNVYLEMGGGPVELIDAAVYHVGAERVLFGSDWGNPGMKFPWPPGDRDDYTHWRNLNVIALSNTTEAQKDMILYKNAARLLKIKMD
jgi:predicted TIM-barrel fold metal-dependent hydrolase